MIVTGILRGVLEQEVERRIEIEVTEARTEIVRERTVRIEKTRAIITKVT